jgi:hypothetical protein
MATPINAVDHLYDASPAWRDSAFASGQSASSELLDSAAGESPPDPTEQPALRIRPYSIVDFPALLRFPGVLRLDVPDSLVLSRSGMFDLQAGLPVLRKDRPAFVAIADGQQVGFVRFSPRRPDGRWVISAIGASTGVFAPEPVWDALLAHGVRAAGLRGVRRVFARIPVGHSLLDAMRLIGWAPYARETVFRAERLAPVKRRVGAVRHQEPADSWAIHQLYASSAPRQVQEIEALTSRFWQLDRSQRIPRGVRQTGWILEIDGKPAAYARFTRGSRAGMIDAVVAPGEELHLGALLDGVMAEPRRGRPLPAYCALRSYHLDLKGELTARGFSEIGEQELLIRYTTATARSVVPDPVHFPVELRQAMPRRVPTFLEGQPTDGVI